MSGEAHRLGIGEMASRFDVSFRTLRFYEERGLLQPIREGHDRFYTATDEIRLQLILKGKRLGFTLQEIGKMIGYVTRRRDDDGPHPRTDIFEVMDREAILQQTAMLERRKAAVEKAIEELRATLGARELEAVA